MGSRVTGAMVAALILLIGVTVWSPIPLRAQQPEHPQMGQRGQQEERLPKEIEDRMAKERLKGRYDNLKRDSERLLELATELKQYVDKSGENVMSLEVIRKCEEIEKLSKSVRTKMKGD